MYAATLVGLTDQEAHTLSQRVFWLYGKPGEKDLHDAILEKVDPEIYGLLGFDLRKAKTVECTIRRKVARNTQHHYWVGGEGWVFGIDIRVVGADGTADKILKDVFLLKVFSDHVIGNHEDGQRRLERTRCLCKPANNLNLQAARFPYGANEDLFAGAPILTFAHHLEQPNRKQRQERFVCYLMKNAGVSRGAIATADQTPVKRWSELRNEVLFRPRHRIALARDLACALVWLHDRGFQHCDLSPQNVLITGDVDSSATPRLALIDFDSYYTAAEAVSLLPVHRQYLFQFGGAHTVARGVPVPPAIAQAFAANGRPLTSRAYIGRVAAGSYHLHDPRPGKRPVNYTVQTGADGMHSIWLLGAPGHQHYQAPVDLLVAAEGCYDNFALGMLIHELLCWVDTDFDGVLIKQEWIDALNGASAPDVSRFCGPTRFILHESIANLLGRVFTDNSTQWPKPKEWADALRNGPIYRLCPGPMRTLRRRTSNQCVCLWPLPRLAGRRAGSWLRQTRPKTRLKWLEGISAAQRTKLLDDRGLSGAHKYCEVCGSPLQLY
jgi:hypothetical protein